MGDYVDRGLYTKDCISWLISIQRKRARAGARTVFLCGNHEFCLLGFLGLLPKPEDEPDFSFSSTWGGSQELRCDRDRLWCGSSASMNEVHIQGRRWAGSWYEKTYGSHATFASYGVDMADREGLRSAMPQEHLDFLTTSPWVHIEESPLLGRLIFVHAGIEADGSGDC